MGGPAARPAAASPIKPSQQPETFRKVAAEMRKAGAAPEVIQPVLTVEQEARQRHFEAKALSKLAAARNAAGQAQASVEAAEAVVAAADTAVATVRQRLEKAQHTHEERLAIVQAEEPILTAPAPKAAEAVALDVTCKAMRVLAWVDKIHKVLLRLPGSSGRFANRSAAAQPMLKSNLRSSREPATEII